MPSGVPTATALQLGFTLAGEAVPTVGGKNPGALTVQLTGTGAIGNMQAGGAFTKAEPEAGAPNAATAKPLAIPETHPEGVPARLTTLGFATTVPSEKLGLNGVSPTNPLIRHCPEIPPASPDINTEPRPRVTTGRNVAVSK